MKEATVTAGAVISGLRHTVLSGTRCQVMTALGESGRDAIARVRQRAGGAWPELVERSEGKARDRFAAVIAGSRARLPEESAEIESIARGAGLPARDLWALNLRGDLGRDGTGCSDLAGIVDGSAVCGHNEDGDAEFWGDLELVTLDIQGDPVMTCLWYPGMLPANAFVATQAGLTFGMDHLPVPHAQLDGAGRHLVARHAQRAWSGPEAQARLEKVPCAGGFAFTVTDRDMATAWTVENVAGVISSAQARPGDPVLHTNHTRFDGGRAQTPPPDDRWVAESRVRLDRLRALVAQCPDVAQGLGALRSAGVCQRNEDLMTLATVTVDHRTDVVCVEGTAAPVRVSFEDFVFGRLG